MNVFRYLRLDSYFVPIKGINLPILLLFIVVFLLNPTVALIASLAYICQKNNASDFDYFVFILIMSSWLGVINMTKVPDSDQIPYTWYFNNVSIHSFKDVWKCIWEYRVLDSSSVSFISMKEIFFNIYSVVCYLLTGGNSQGYYFLMTITFYVFHLLALYLLLSKSKRKKYEIILASCLLCFFAPLFMQSIHACRQELATAFVLYAIAFRVVTGRNNWLFLTIAVLTHNSVLFFVALAIIPQFYTKISWGKVALIFGGYIVFVTLYAQIGRVMAAIDIEAIASAGGRLAKSRDEGENGMFNMRGFMIYAFPVIFVSIVNLIKNLKERMPSPMNCISYFCILTFFMILAFTGASTLQGRYSFYIYSMTAFILPFLYDSKHPNQKFWCSVICVFYIFRFFFIDDWGWDYAPMSEILTNTFFHFWNTVYYTV